MSIDSATGLKAKDATGTSDPFVTVKFLNAAGGFIASRETSAVQKSLSPVWGTMFDNLRADQWRNVAVLELEGR